MDSEDSTVAGIAAAIGEPARARMLFCLMDGCARTSTELSVVADVSPSTAGGARGGFVPSTPTRLRAARTCYDHLAGRVGVFLHDRFTSLEWLSGPDAEAGDYELTRAGTEGFSALGIDLDGTHAKRRRFACACLDWSERRPHLGGALGAAVLQAALRRKWLTQDLDSRALDLTDHGRRELGRRFGAFS